MLLKRQNVATIMVSKMRFEWDETKRLTNIQKHGIDFVECVEVFGGITKTVEDSRFGYSEHRFITVGLMHDTVIVIAHNGSDDVIRIISARKATKHEQRLFFEGIQE